MAYNPRALIILGSCNPKALLHSSLDPFDLRTQPESYSYTLQRTYDHRTSQYQGLGQGDCTVETSIESVKA